MKEKQIDVEEAISKVETQNFTRVRDDSVSLMNLTQTLEEMLTDKQLRIVVEIGISIGNVGLSLNDACLRSRISRDELEALWLHVPEIKTYIQLKQVEYKYKLLNVVTNDAIQNGNVKIASWLLERQYAEEYDSSMKKDMAKVSRNSQDDVVEMAFAYVRRSNTNAMPVNSNAGDEEDRSDIDSKIMELKDILV